MKIKKLKKFSQKLYLLAFIFALSTMPTFATLDSACNSDAFCKVVRTDVLGDGVGQNLNVDVEPYFSLEKTSGSNMNGVTTIASSTSLTITTPITFSYNLASNESGAISISATAPVSDGTGTVNALFGTAANAMKIVFTKSDATAASAAVTNASSSSPTASSNAKAVAFTFTPQTVTATLGTAPTPTVENNALLYNFGAGDYNIPFKIEGSSLTGTFSKNDDTSGDYKATLIVSKVDLD